MHRLKEFSKKCESFLFVEVINKISILLDTRMDGLDIWKHFKAVRMVANSIF